jgi:hypothetical protein
VFQLLVDHFVVELQQRLDANDTQHYREQYHINMSELFACVNKFQGLNMPNYLRYSNYVQNPDTSGH